MADAASELVALYQEDNIQRMVYVVAVALFCYDFCLTLGREVRLVWRRRFSTSSILYYAVRYSAVFSTIILVMNMTYWKGISDWVLFSALRVYALWDRNPWISSTVLILGMVNPAISIYAFTQMQTGEITVPTTGCGFYPVISEGVYENWMVGARLSSVLADVLVLFVTCTRMWSIKLEATQMNATAHFTTILMRDGGLYFVVLLVANVIGLGLARRLELVEPASTWIALVTTILTSRFILDLHEAADTLARGDATQFSEPGTLPSMAFRTHPDGSSHGPTRARGVLSSIYGASLTHVAALNDWDESQYAIDDLDMAVGPSEDPELI